MNLDLGKKLRTLRKAEGATQLEFSHKTGIALSSIRNYETGGDNVGLKTIQNVLSVDEFQKYTLWLMIDKTSEAAGQISPALSHNGHEKTDLTQLTGRAG